MYPCFCTKNLEGRWEIPVTRTWSPATHLDYNNVMMTFFYLFLEESLFLTEFIWHSYFIYLSTFIHNLMWWLTEGGRQGFQVRERNHPNTCNFVPSSGGKGRGLVLQVEQSNDNDSGKSFFCLGLTQWRKVKWNQCDFACSDPIYLSKHLKSHSGEKSMNTTNVTLPSYMSKHLKSHSGEK